MLRESTWLIVGFFATHSEYLSNQNGHFYCTAQLTWIELHPCCKGSETLLFDGKGSEVFDSLIINSSNSGSWPCLRTSSLKDKEADRIRCFLMQLDWFDVSLTSDAETTEVATRP